MAMDTKTSDTSTTESKLSAQQRVNQIQTFRAELQLLQDEQVVALSQEQTQAIESYHGGLLSGLKAGFDIDLDTSDKQLSLGLKLASLFGALGLAAGLFFLFYQYWGEFTPLVQSVTLLLSPLLMLAICWVCVQRDSTGYYGKIAGFLSLTCFVLNLSMLGQIYNISPSPDAFLVWSVMSLGLAYLTKSRLLLSFAILLFSGFLSARMGTWFGIYWLSFGEHPENFFLPALLIFACGHVTQKHYESFAAIFRIFGILLLLLPVLVLSHWAGGSYLSWSQELVEGMYQALGFMGAGGFIAWGIKRGWNDVINTGATMFTLFFYTKIFDWFWDLIPRYLFFILIGLISLLILVVFKRLRNEHKVNITSLTKEKQDA